VSAAIRDEHVLLWPQSTRASDYFGNGAIYFVYVQIRQWPVPVECSVSWVSVFEMIPIKLLKLLRFMK
jgi:hypothetical protein